MLFLQGCYNGVFEELRAEEQIISKKMDKACEFLMIDAVIDEPMLNGFYRVPIFETEINKVFF